MCTEPDLIGLISSANGSMGHQYRTRSLISAVGRQRVVLPSPTTWDCARFIAHGVRTSEEPVKVALRLAALDLD
jgi:hypothetical protein